MLCVSNGQNPLGEKTARRLHSDCTSSRQQRWDNSISNEPIASIQRVTLELLMRVRAVFLLCIVFALLFIDDILYNDEAVSIRFLIRRRKTFSLHS